MPHYKIIIILVLFFCLDVKSIYARETNIQITNILTTNEQNTNIADITNDQDTIFNNGLQELQKGNIAEAIFLLEKLLSYNTANPDYYIYLGYTYYVQGNYDKATEVLLKSLEFDDNLPASHILLGEIYYQLNSISRARDEFEKVILINPNVKLAHIRLYELFKDNNPTKANKHYLRIFHLPITKLEKFLPDIDKIGNIKLPFNRNVLVLKNIVIDKHVSEGQQIIDEILQGDTDSSNRKEIIVSVKDKKFDFDVNMNFLLDPIRNFDKEKFYTKIIELIFLSIFMLIYSFFIRKRGKKLEKIVLNQYRINTSNKE